MSDDHCQYVVFPDDGRNPFVVPAHPYPEHISDDLGGASPVAIMLPASYGGMWVREDAAETGHQKNPVASIIATMLNTAGMARPTIILGPAVLTRIIPYGVNIVTGHVDLAQEGFDKATAEGLALVAADVRAAVAGSNGPFETSGLNDTWPYRVRAFADRLAATPVPESWPDSENTPPPIDHISAGLERHFKGRRFVDYPPGPTH